MTEGKYRSFIENLPVMFYAVEPTAPYSPLYISPAFVRFGYEISDWMSDPKIWERVIHDEDREWVFAQTAASTESGVEVDYEYRIVDANGTIHWVRDRGCLIRGENGEVLCREGVILDITDRKRVEEELIRGEERFRNIFDNASDIIYVHDLEGNYLSINGAGERIFGYTIEETLKMNVRDVVASEHLEHVRRRIAEKLHGGSKQTSYDLECIRKDGTQITLEVNSSVIYKDGSAVAIQGIARDITDRKRIEAALIESEHRYRQLGEGILHQIWTALPNGMLDYVNKRTLQYFDLTCSEITGDGWRSAVHPDDLEAALLRWNHSLATGEAYETEFRLLRHDGHYRWHVARATAGYDANGRIIKWFGTNTDIHEQKESEEKLNYYARHDTLTDLPNRAEFMIQLRSSIERATSSLKARFAVIFLDLDRFKIINDSLGHVVGDKLLIAISKRLRGAVRPGDIVARLGGDEFTILLNRTGSEADISKVVERLQRELSLPFFIDNYEVFTTASVGVVVSDERIREADDYLRDADSAMYRAKEGGKARFEFFNREMHVRNMNQLQLETDLRHAVERNEFEVYYQPIVDLRNERKLNEFEALIRWRHPKHGLISPLEFVSIAEETGLIIPIGKWVIEEACRQISVWQREVDQTLSVSVNLSAKQLMHPSLTSQVQEILQEYGLDPRQLNLEVTESTVMENSERALTVLNELDELGVRLSTDDFGTGYSSLSYLQRFPFDRLKIDRSFIDTLGENVKTDAIVKTILILGDNLGMEVVAEGIETKRQLDLLRLHGCEFGQGYIFSRPVDADEARTLLDEYGRVIARQDLSVAKEVLEYSAIQ